MCVDHRQTEVVHAILAGMYPAKASKFKLNILSWPTDAGQQY